MAAHWTEGKPLTQNEHSSAVMSIWLSAVTSVISMTADSYSAFWAIGNALARTRLVLSGLICQGGGMNYCITLWSA